jgi:four helix bundle protein
MSLATDVYLAARSMQRDDRFVLGTQLQRSAISVPSNLAEGWARNQRRVLEAHVRIALGSGAELQTQLELARRVDALREDVGSSLLARSEEVGRMLSGLLRSVAQPPSNLLNPQFPVPSSQLLAPSSQLPDPSS